MISVKDLTKKYGTFEALKGISFDIQQGEIVGLLGPNGAGKTTTLKIISGYLNPTSGLVTVDNDEVSEKPIKVKQKLGYLPETNPLYDDMKVEEYIRYAAEVKNVSKQNLDTVVADVIKKTGLTEKAGQLISKLSKGYKQRVGLAQALVNDPQILILDEPTEGLDPNQRIEIRNLIRELGKQRTVIFSSHILSEVEAVCDRVLIIHHGQLVASGTPAELKSQIRKTTRIHLLTNGPQDLVSTKLLGHAGVERILEITKDDLLNRYTIEVDSTLELRPGLVKMLMANSWDVFEITKEEKSLEDVFVSLTK